MCVCVCVCVCASVCEEVTTIVCFYIAHIVYMERQCGSSRQTTHSQVDKLISSGDNNEMCNPKWSSYLDKILEHITLPDLGIVV